MRILSGIQPSGQPHLGNYFGMMRPAVELQSRGDCYYFIADYHALTSLGSDSDVKARSLEVAVDFLACGLEPDKTVLFRQSAVPEVHELAWYLSNVAPMGLLERCHSYKDKVARGLSANHGLFAYPVLMTADILLYEADLVPVGKDQVQHLEVARDLAKKFNDTYGETFRIPELALREEAATLPGIDGQKMSKSYGNTIGLFAPENEFKKRVMAIKTDSSPVEAPKAVEGSVLLALARCVAPAGVVVEMEESMLRGGRGYGDYKKQLFGLLWESLTELRAKREALARDPGYVLKVLQEGEKRARETASTVLTKARKAVGIA
ncbi:MAG: tryptophan--tRNA ligase [Blastochloris sp.]|nr:tryptophan--tRNA ligase [Blastochloris sp.]